MKKYKELNVPKNFTYSTQNCITHCNHPDSTIITESGTYIRDCPIGHKWDCLECLAHLSNEEIAKSYFRLKKLETLSNEN